MPEINASKQIRLFSESILIAVVPILAYAISFTFESGFCSYFGLPVWLIQIDLTTIFVMTSVLLVVLGFVAAFLNLLTFILPSSDWPFMRPFTRLLPSTILVLAMLAVYGRDFQEWGWTIIVFAFTALLPVIEVYFSTKSSKLPPAPTGDANMEGLRTRSLIDSAISRFGANTIWLLLTTCFVFFLAYHAGRAQAKHQREFVLLPSHNDVVVLRPYGTDLICASIDSDNVIDATHLQIINRHGPESTKIVFTNKVLGPLRPKH